MSATRNQVTTTAIAARLPMPANAGIKADQWRVLTDAIFPNAKNPESVMMALAYCKSRNLDPFKRPVHIVPMWSTASRKMIETVWPGINELQVTAARSGAWAGMDEPVWGPEVEHTFVGNGGQDENGNSIPAATVTVRFNEWCSITVYRLVGNQRVAFSEPVYWMEAYARAARGTEIPNDMWRKRPKGQHIKCAKAASLRAGFPEDLGSTYAAEEMEDREIAATGPVIDAKVESTITQEEESEFLVRAASTLEANASNASSWLKLLLSLLTEVPTVAELGTLLAWEDVRKARKDAPSLVRTQIEDAIKAAQARLAEPVEVVSTPSEPIAESAVEISDPEDGQAAELATSVTRCTTQAEVEALVTTMKRTMTKWRKEKPDLFKRVDDVIAAKIAAFKVATSDSFDDAVRLAGGGSGA